ncbi:MAG: peptidase M14 carboxypeptidase A [Limisphaerales bacterium]|nr:MAG: peptidase M14 carboxypeptidase A [Limisphaerales bacterium]KAG0508346.1 MAG: peptidase M14 carboxypeptidase A [Limisphaerales bacterium]TXT52013.1 MAG: peptidase M14 carboxypeptidase A [Limisphaerales bacterium]
MSWLQPSRSARRWCGLLLCGAFTASAQPRPPVTFNKAFEGASLGKIEKLDDATFRLHVEGQYDERGRNRQTTWFYFRMDHVAGRELTLTFTDWVGEYNDRPGACPMGPTLRPVFSYDGETWQHTDAVAWDDVKKESTLKFKPGRDTVWLAHIPPYPHARLLKLLGEVETSPHARVEVIGKTALGRDLHLVTVTDFTRPDAAKQVVWLQARQHAWEAGTSHVMEGALRFVTSDEPVACALRERVVFKFTPMMDPDGCALGKVRFNAHGWDVNRHWDEVDLRDPRWLRLMPEIWYVKQAILVAHAEKPIALMVNMHNTETAEYLDTMVDDEPGQARLQRLFAKLVADTSFDPSRKLGIVLTPTNTTNVLWKERRVPVALMEQRVGPSAKLGRLPTVADRLAFGRQLITRMAEAALAPP